MLSNVQKLKQSQGETGKYNPNKQTKTCKSPAINPNEMEICNLPGKELKIIIIKMLTKVKRVVNARAN